MLSDFSRILLLFMWHTFQCWVYLCQLISASLLYDILLGLLCPGFQNKNVIAILGIQAKLSLQPPTYKRALYITKLQDYCLWTNETMIILICRACLATMGILYYRLAQRGPGEELSNDEQRWNWFWKLDVKLLAFSCISSHLLPWFFYLLLQASNGI